MIVSPYQFSGLPDLSSNAEVITSWAHAGQYDWGNPFWFLIRKEISSF
jgi:hypothetical protein